MNATIDIVPKYQALMRPVLNALTALGGSGSNEEIYDKVIELEKFPEDIQGIMLPSGNMTKLADRVGWARSYLKMVGALDNITGSGIWAITPEGETLTDEEILKRIKTKLKEGHEARKQKEREARAKLEQRRQQRLGAGAEEQEAIEQEVSEQESEEEWRDELLSVLYGIHPSAFERLSQRLLREAGFTKVEVTGQSGDGGIDGIGVLRINLLSFTVFFQCKRYRGSVGAPAIRDFRGAMMGRADKGLVITTGTFTADARKEATRDGATAIDLIDGDDLAQLLKKYQLGITTQIVEAVTIDPQFFHQL